MKKQLRMFQTMILEQRDRQLRTCQTGIPERCDAEVAYEAILDISLFFTQILSFSCCSLSMANTGDLVIYLHYFDFVNFYKNV